MYGWSLDISGIVFMRFWVVNLLLCSILVIFTPKCFAKQAEDVEVLCNRDYYSTAIDTIMNAKEEIVMVMYNVCYEKDNSLGPVSKLVEALVRAKDRGVKVKVILELPRWEDRTDRTGNWRAYSFLKEKGIDVVFDTGGVVTHGKVLVVDNRIVILGSTNWSNTSIEKNNEANVKIVSSSTAKDIKDWISKIETQYLDVEVGDVVWVPCKIICSGGAFPHMVIVHAERAMDLYLYLLYLHSNSLDEVKGDFETLASYLGLTGRMDEIGYRRQIVKVMRKLDRRYNLIRFSYEFGKGYNLRFVPCEGESFPLSVFYWKHKWDKVLDLTSKFCLLINFCERGRFQGEYSWEGSRNFICSKYGISLNNITKGMTELERYDLLDIKYADYLESRVHKGPTIYKFKELYDWDEDKREMDNLEKEYGDLYVKAKRYSGVVYKDFCCEAIKRIIGLIQEYGLENVDRAFQKLSFLKKDNPKRNLNYAIGILRSKREIIIF